MMHKTAFMARGAAATLMWVLLASVPSAFGEEFVDPPGRVARLAFVEGAVSIAAADTDAWSEALVNRPLTSGDRIWVDAGARAELDLGTMIIRLDQNTSFSFAELTDDVLTARLNEGVLQLHALRADGAIEITTPSAAVTVLQPGDYTVDAAPSGQQTVVKNYDGAVEVAGPEQLSYGVAAGEQGVFSSAPTFSAEIAALAPRSEFEAWAYARDAAAVAPITANYVAPEVVGYRDLDRYGSWSATTDYGYVWRPSYVVADWAPYRYGRWVWVTPWGWTWVDDAPWGFAPFHYGRWVYLRSRWCWAPGPRYIRPVYAPALVGWIGHPGSPYGNVGWFPLAPREAYLPGYRTSWRYFRNVNIANTTIINTTYINDAYYGRAAPTDYRHRHTPHAATVVPRDTFASGRPLGPHHAVPDGDALNRWVAQGRPPAIEPSRASRFGARSAVHPPRAVSTAATAAPRHRADMRRSAPDLRTPTNTTPADFRTPINTTPGPFRTREVGQQMRTPTGQQTRTPTYSPTRLPRDRPAVPVAAQERTPGPRIAIQQQARTPTYSRTQLPRDRPAVQASRSPQTRTPINSPSRAPRQRLAAPVAAQERATGPRSAVQQHWSGRRVDERSTHTERRAGPPPDRARPTTRNPAASAPRVPPSPNAVAASPRQQMAPRGDAARGVPRGSALGQPTQREARTAPPGRSNSRTTADRGTDRVVRPAAGEQHHGFDVRQPRAQSRALGR